MIFTIMVLIHGWVIFKEGLSVFRENEGQTMLGIYFVLSEAGLIFFDIAAILDLVSGEVPGSEDKKEEE